jgi:hypothetical protein
MTSNNTYWEKGWFYLRNDGAGLPPYTGKVLMGKPDSWFHCMSPSSWLRKLESFTNALCQLADIGLGVTSVIANFHHRRIIPLMERELRIYEMSNAANLVSLARSRLLQECLPKGYAATHARHGSTSRWCQTATMTLGRS